jgi:hypothetical protein
MSKGPGRCQRGILAALEAAPAVELRGLLGEEATRSQRVALHRAANVLQAKGVIGMFSFWDVGPQQTVYVLHRMGYDVGAHARTHGLTPSPHGYWIREQRP